MNILFVCTGNVFRSFSAQRCAQALKTKHQFDSAGKYGWIPQKTVYSALTELGINDAPHTPKGVTDDLVEWADVIVAMTNEHKAFLKEEFGADAILFNTLAVNEDTDVVDVPDKLMLGWWAPRGKLQPAVDQTVQYIHKHVPTVIKRAHESHS